VNGLRYFGGAVAFGFAAIWIMASLDAAFVCLASAAVGYGLVFVGERRRAKRVVRVGTPAVSTPSRLALPHATPEVEDVTLWADALNNDLGHVYEPTATSPLSAVAQYGWPLNDDTANASETLH
jgi:hypothetical protein